MGGPEYREFDHTGDLGLEITGADLASLFRNSALALGDLLYDPSRVDPAEEIGILVRGGDTADLLVRFLAEVLYLFDVRGFQSCGFEFPRLGETELRALARGEPIDPDRHRLRQSVKAVTYHQAEVRRTPAGAWRARVILDV